MRLHRLAALLLALVPGAGAVADVAGRHDLPVIALLIDDMGEHRAAGLRAIDLPGAVTFSFLPYRTHVRELAQRARDRDREILLHLPMEALDRRALGAGAITARMSEQELVDTLRDALAAVPHASGINNHMGSLLTRNPVHMQWLMREIGSIGNLYFVDSRTTPESVAAAVAAQFGVPNLERDVFLDNTPTRPAIAAQFERLVARAKQRGVALGIGHPYQETLAVLERELPRLTDHGVRLVPVSDLIKRQRLEPPVRMAAGHAAGNVKAGVPARAEPPVMFYQPTAAGRHE